VIDPAGCLETSYGSFARTGLPIATSSNATYEANNRLTAWNGTTLTYDNDGNPTTYGTTTFSWNARNQLTATSAGSASFAYDGLGRRITRTVGGVTTKYLHAGPDVVQELNGSGGVTANLLTGLGVDELYRRTETVGPTRDLLTDRLGSTLALTDTTGAVQTSYTYESFGKATVTGAASTNGFQFTGRENDGASNLFFYRARYYNPVFQRFLSEDPIGFGSRDANAFVYVGNAPTVYKDPLGLERTDPGPGRRESRLRCGRILRRREPHAWLVVRNHSGPHPRLRHKQQPLLHRRRRCYSRGERGSELFLIGWRGQRLELRCIRNGWSCWLWRTRWGEGFYEVGVGWPPGASGTCYYVF
jgi:RHS repeat-associated protein